MSKPQAFVTVSVSEMAHNKGELFYRVSYVDFSGMFWGVVDNTEYPWAWGFKDIKNALKIANHYNREWGDEDDESTIEMVRRLAKEERQ